jgi:hypothetical protein
VLIDKSKTGVTQWMGLGNNKMNLVQNDNQLLLNNVVVGLIDTMNAIVVTLNGKQVRGFINGNILMLETFLDYYAT